MKNEKPQELASMRSVATLMLLLMAAVYIATFIYQNHANKLITDLGPWIRAFSEAAMVGALADWFAVTALFRHPLGIPFPHSAIITRNKGRIGTTIGEFIADNFLTENVISGKIRKIQPAQSISKWLALPFNRQKLIDRCGEAACGIIEASDDGAIKNLFNHVIRDTILKFRLAAACANILDAMIAQKKHTEIVDSLFKVLAHAIKSHQNFIIESIKGGLPWWVPGFVKNRMYDAVLEKIVHTLNEINQDHDHILRQKLNEGLNKLVIRLRTDQSLIAETERFKIWLLDDPIASDYLSKLFVDIKERLLIDLKSNQSAAKTAFNSILDTLSHKLIEDKEAQARLDQRVNILALRLAHDYTPAFIKLIAETVESWDAKTLIEKIELEVGRDLQFIRINGTLVGGCIGIVLHIIHRLLDSYASGI